MHTNHVRPVRTVRPLSRQLDLNLLDLFETIYRTRNLTQSGSQLGLTQPAVSRGLARLREMYGDALFVRQQRGVSPTPFADSLVGQIAQALEIVRATIRRPTFAPEHETRTFRVAMSDIGERLFLPRLMTCVTRHAPRVVVEVVSPAEGELRDGLASGQIDLAVGYLGNLSKQMHQRRLFTERFVYVARRDHPQITAPLRREQLRELSHVVAGPTGMLHAAAVEKVLSSPRVRACVALRVHSFLGVGPVVASTDLVSAVPSNLAATVAEHMGLQLLEPPVRFPTFEVALIWHQRFHGDPGNEWLRAMFASLFGGSAF
ncbi:LysR family transcriptional regulator [Paraburkholderia sp. BL23I1N1]|uniref:LysR family transcriptional regulator n=1 Tax=Paraburkholderia sp. BL23I1N1 TaxID=1938802 RepID=UPI000E742176|nr:LysR family transcriptional regulator [Paraburkholderia sp. BL23I1N1]RKE38636.1 LysR family transcriptional regulator [Paraburkholderia sp. BL23I1N1]